MSQTATVGAVQVPLKVGKPTPRNFQPLSRLMNARNSWFDGIVFGAH